MRFGDFACDRQTKSGPAGVRVARFFEPDEGLRALTLRGLAYAGAFKACRFDYHRFCAGVPPAMGAACNVCLGTREA